MKLWIEANVFWDLKKKMYIFSGKKKFSLRIHRIANIRFRLSRIIGAGIIVTVSLTIDQELFTSSFKYIKWLNYPSTLWDWNKFYISIWHMKRSKYKEVICLFKAKHQGCGGIASWCSYLGLGCSVRDSNPSLLREEFYICDSLSWFGHFPSGSDGKESA